MCIRDRGHAVEEDRHREGGHLLIGDHAAGVGVDHPVDLVVAQDLAIPLGADDVYRIEWFGHCSASLRSSASKASGRTSLMVLIPRGVATRREAPPCSHSSCRQRPHGMTRSPLPPTHTKWVRRPPPELASAETTPHSAQSVTP